MFEECVKLVKCNGIINAIDDMMKSFIKTTSLCFLSTCFKRSHNSEIKILFDILCMLPKGPHNSLNTVCNFQSMNGTVELNSLF